MVEWIDFVDETIIVGVSIFLWKLVDRISKRSWRTERALVLFIKLLVKEKKKLHPEEAKDFDQIEEMVNVILEKGENGKG